MATKNLGRVVGKSAYEVWLGQGNTGSETDFLNSLKGADGKDGVNGQDGFSPIATVQETTTGATITITDKNGTTTTNITNGKDGERGIPGEKGENGYTPIKGTDYWTEADKNEIKEYVKDEIPHNTSQLINDSNFLTSVPSEYITETELNNKKYLTSIPSDYKTKTENDSLYQAKGSYLTSYTESDPTVPSHVKNIKATDISNWNSKSTFSGSYNDLTNKPTKVSEFENDADYITNKTSVISERLSTSVYGWKTGYYCNYNTGKIAGGVAHYSVTDYIEISPKWQKIKAYIRADGDLAGVGFYDSSKGFISGVQIPDTNDAFELFEYDIPEGAVYVCVSNRPETNVDSYIEVEWEADGLLTRMSEMEKQIESVSTKTNAISYGYVASNILCIGDSLTAGAFYAGEANDLDIARGTAIAQNYPYFLSRMLDCRTTNAGTNGYSPSDWYSKYINKYTYEDYDTFIIWLGTNYGCNSMPTDAEISAFVPESSPTASTANQSLYLIKIIETIQASNTSCHIVLCSVFGSKSNKETHNGIVAQIANKYNCQLVDMSDLGYSDHPELHAGINDPHFGKAGNVFVANRLALAINDYIVSNPRTGDFGITTEPMPTLTESEKEEISQLLNEKGYLTSIPSDYKTKTENDSLYQAKGNYLTSVPSEYVTETELNNKGYLTEVELSQEQLDEIAEEVASAMSYVEPKTIPYTVTKSCVQAPTGKIGSTSDHMRTDYITLTGYDTIKYVGKCANSKMAIGFFDANQEPMLSEGVVGHGTATKEVIKTIPQGAVYAICSAYVGSNTSTEWVVDVYYSKSNPTAEAIEGLKSSVYSFEGKKVMFFGDSITYDGNMYRNNLIEKTKMVEVACFALNGATMRNHSDTVMDGNPVALQHSNTIPNQVQKLLNTSTSYETPDIVIISAATNDSSAEASYDETQYTDENYNYIDVDTVNLKTFSGAMRWAYEKIISLYPNTKIFFATPIQCGAGSSRTFASLKTKAECIRQNCERLSTPCIDAFRKSGIYGRYDVSGANGKYLKDGLHPNSAGAVVLAKCYHKELANALID